MEGGGSSPLADLVFENNRCWDLLRNDLVENGGGRRIARLQLRQSLVCRLNLGHEDKGVSMIRLGWIGRVSLHVRSDAPACVSE